MSSKLLRQCFFAYNFPHFAWIFPFIPLLAQTQHQILQQKCRVGLRLVYRCPFVSAQNLYSFTSEHSLEFYVKNYIQRRLRTIHLTDLGSSPFYNDIFVWDEIFKRKNDSLGHFFHWSRVRQLIDRHESYPLTLSLWDFFLTLKPYRPIYGTPVAKELRWISFVETN